MSTQEIQAAIENLSPAELRELISWLEDYAAKRLQLVDAETREKIGFVVRKSLGGHFTQSHEENLRQRRKEGERPALSISASAIQASIESVEGVKGGASRMTRQLSEQITNEGLCFANSDREWTRIKISHKDTKTQSEENPGIAAKRRKKRKTKD